VIRLFERYQQDEINYIIKEEIIGQSLLSFYLENTDNNEKNISLLIEQMLHALEHLHIKDLIYRNNLNK